MKNILIVASLTPITTANYLVKAFKKLNYNLLVYSDVDSPLSDVVGPCIFRVDKFLKKKNFHPDLLFFIEGGTMELFPVGLEEVDCPTAWYGIDTHLGYSKHFNICKVFDISFVAQHEYVEKLKRDGIEQVFWLPLAFDLQTGLKTENDRRFYDLAYIGTIRAKTNPTRNLLLKELRKRYPESFLGKANPGDISKIYGSSKIVFNWSINNDINMRFFEAMGSGAVLLTNTIKDNGLELLFNENEEYVNYTGLDSLLNKVDFLLKNDQVREVIGKNAQIKILDRHTYEHRVDQILKTAKSLKKQSAITPAAYLDLFNSMKHLTGLIWLFEQTLDNAKTRGAKKTGVEIIQGLLFVLRYILQLLYKLRNRSQKSQGVV